jgi:hypothetical protein
MENTTETNGIFTLAIDWQGGRTPNYETYLRWNCTAEQAAKFFAKNEMVGYGHRRALIAPDGTTVTTLAAI